MFRIAILLVAMILIAGCAAHNTIESTEMPASSVSEEMTIGPGFYAITEQTNMYENADLGSRRLERLEAGEMVEVVEVAGSFAQIRYSDNAGWVHSDEVEETGVPNILRAVGLVRVKASPEERSSDTEMLDSGRLLTLKKRSGEWMFVKISENRGWILVDVLKPIGEAGSDHQAGSQRIVRWKVYKKSNLRSSPSIVSEILRLIPSGSLVKYIGTEGDWVRIEYDGTVGYIHQDLVGPD